MFAYEFEIPNEIAYLIFALFFASVIIFFLVLNSTKKKRAFLSELIHTLMQNGMSKIKIVKKEMYQLTYEHKKITYYVKIINGGSKKGIVMTNAHTVYIQQFKNETSSYTSSDVLYKLTPFLSEAINGKKVVIIYDNLLRATRYVNENEVEAITYAKDAFGIRFVEAQFFKDYLQLIKKDVIKNGKASN